MKKLWNSIPVLSMLLVTSVKINANSDSSYSTGSVDASSVNDLAYKPSSALSLDPKIRKALLNILNRLEAQEQSTTLPRTSDQTTSAGEKSHHNQTTSRKYLPLPSLSNPVKFEYKEFAEKPTDPMQKKFSAQRLEPKPKSSFQLSAAKISVAPAEFSNSLTNEPERQILQKPNISQELDALFFQIPQPSTLKYPSSVPTTQQPSNKLESLAVQESKNIFSPEEILTKYLLQQRAEKEAIADAELSPQQNSLKSVKNQTDNFNDEQKDGEEVEDEKDAHTQSTQRDEESKKVEVFQAPLLTAFTLEQDARGIPHRIIPLSLNDYQLNSVVSVAENSKNSDEFHEHNQPAQSVTRSVQNSKSNSNTYQANFPLNGPQASVSQFSLNPVGQVQDQKARTSFQVPGSQQLSFDPQVISRNQRIHQALEDQKQKLHAQQVEKAKSDNFAFQQEQRLREAQLRPNLPQFAANSPRIPLGLANLNFRANTIPQPSFNNFAQITWQKSLESPIQFHNFHTIPQYLQQQQQQTEIIPSVPIHNHYQQLSARARGHSAISGHPESVDRRLQILLQQSGLNNGYRQEDLNIVSKVLALNVDKPQSNQLDDANTRH